MAGTKMIDCFAASSVVETDRLQDQGLLSRAYWQMRVQPRSHHMIAQLYVTNLPSYWDLRVT